MFVLPVHTDGEFASYLRISRHRSGPHAPERWAIHRTGRGLSTIVFNGTEWINSDIPIPPEHASYLNGLEALRDALRIAEQETAQGAVTLDANQPSA
ncbi:hypothetical protein [Streptomyces sp. NPDC001948]